ncbi:MAG TPA: PTS sugar transporter subunit IIA [Pseudonocardiaceae bacterium]|jgi:PTS system mannitol-specific IIA component/phosphocarrier protein FPr|nr:PTS sugar transporter subunit IIA [Pseudonocardiaceae bacterium]
MTGDNSTLLQREAVRLGRTARDRWDAIDQVGQALLEIGATTEEYVLDMHSRERSASTYVGRGVAIPHGTYFGTSHIRHSALVVVQFPNGVDWDGDRAQLCVGIAATGDQQIGLLCSLGHILMDADLAAELCTATDRDRVITLLNSVDN